MFGSGNVFRQSAHEQDDRSIICQFMYKPRLKGDDHAQSNT